jgi:uncharacterized protein with PQ loop repeat
MLDLMGWVGSILLGICGIPQAVQSIKQKHSDGLSWSFLIAWTLGELITFVYIIGKQDYPLMLNYSINVVSTLIILYYKLYPQK